MLAKFFIAEYGTATPWEEDIDIYMYLFIYLLQLSFHPVAAVGRLIQNIGERQHKRSNNTQKIQKHRIHKIDNKNTTQKTNMQAIQT